MVFIAQNLGREYAVQKDPRTGPIPFDPPEMLQIAEGRSSRPTRSCRFDSMGGPSGS
jgi:hypothetical protein